MLNLFTTISVAHRLFGIRRNFTLELPRCHWSRSNESRHPLSPTLRPSCSRFECIDIKINVVHIHARYRGALFAAIFVVVDFTRVARSSSKFHSAFDRQPGVKIRIKTTRWPAPPPIENSTNGYYGSRSFYCRDTLSNLLQRMFSVKERGEIAENERLDECYLQWLKKTEENYCRKLKSNEE